mmetsp:Transcript_5178/g.11485  ORF Transcript_5178/g.11485 Transcript_5178/m.11485 type:complete len:103 (+) Transcript_5178:591-899(+)
MRWSIFSVEAEMKVADAVTPSQGRNERYPTLSPLHIKGLRKYYFDLKISKPVDLLSKVECVAVPQASNHSNAEPNLHLKHFSIAIHFLVTYSTQSLHDLAST